VEEVSSKIAPARTGPICMCMSFFRCGRVDLQQQKADTMACGALVMFSFYCLPRLGSHCVAITVDGE
jgi:hypothetical protein